MESGSVSLKLIDRQSLNLTGVKDILSFTDAKIAVLTFDGVLTVAGKGLQIKKFGSDEEALITGRINSLVFTEGSFNGKSFLSKLVK